MNAIVVGHSTVLFDAGPFHILTDPNFDSSMGFIMRRIVKPALNIDELLNRTIIVITHSHVDHLSLSSIRQIKDVHAILCPKKTGKYFKDIHKDKVFELDYGESKNIASVDITALPAMHPSSRYMWGGKTKTNSYIIRINGKTIFFVGDSGYSPVFKNIGLNYSIDVAFLPIGLATPSFLFGKDHLSPADAVKVFVDLKAKLMIPVHYGTFRTILERHTWPLKEFCRLTRLYNLEKKVIIPQFGERFEF
ncbi:MAG TPA: MBL fold metallo-hydrolase [Nitrospirae bacterium]|nr:MBL fold metallo-hydrolase [Nitrospirota bacterium]